MAVYDPTQWQDAQNRGGVTGTTEPPPLASYDPNGESANINFGDVLNRGGVTGSPSSPPPSMDGGTPRGLTSAQTDRRAGIAAAYQKYLGRDITEPEYAYWQNSPNYEMGIAGSQEATQRAYGNQQSAPSGQGSATPTAAPGSLGWVQQQLAKYKSTDDPNYWVGVMAKDPKVAAGDQSAIDYWLYRMSIGDGAEAVRNGTLKPFDHGGGANGGFASNAGNAFSDPATSQWETLVRQLTDRLNNPMPDSAKELQQTQALDPMERERANQKQQAALRLSQRGIQPGSGVYDETMRNIDQQFNQLRTRTQAGFANSWAQNEDNRMLQAANLFKQIPQYQDSRLQLAQNTMIPTNVGSLLQMQQQGSQFDAAQQQAFWSNLANALATMFSGK